MSTNLHIFAERRGTITWEDGTVEPYLAREKAPLWQTPTELTWKIMESDNPLEVYKQWVAAYDDDDEHVQDLDAWLAKHADWAIKYEAW